MMQTNLRTAAPVESGYHRDWPPLWICILCVALLSGCGAKQSPPPRHVQISSPGHQHPNGSLLP
ncbi:MAG: hypothetical protein JWM11_6300, partial [Planctomycetaceae bacterium]|nr:hypothetical protein [Planctomycetaceae bacterium]